VNEKLKIFVTAAALLVNSLVSADTMAIKGARIYTMDAAGTIQDGTVLIRDGKIDAIGVDVIIPNDARIIDAAGSFVTPGLFDPHSYLGVVEISLIDVTVDSVQSDSRYSASFQVSDAINPRSTLIPINRIEGVTRAIVAPQSSPDAGSSPISGLGAAIQLGSIENFLLRRDVALFVVLGEKGAKLSGGSRSNTLLKLREALEDARHFQTNRAGFDSGQSREYSLSRPDLEALLPVLDSEIPMVAHVHRASDIDAALDLADEFGLRLVVSGGAEAWLVADRLAAANVPVILNPLDNLPQQFESLGATLSNAARLHEAGVLIAFSTEETHNARNMKQLAGNAVANGLPYEAALAAITLNPARIFGLDKTMGSLAAGKDADIVIWDADPLELTAFATRVFIAGREIPMVSRSTLLRDRYLERDKSLPPAYRN
jgi:imidazolonepropionase-like amidohydrolase